MKKFGNIEQPVVMEKRSRHREVESFHLPGDPEGYYKGYEGDKLVMVPKGNLQAMKQLVNYKMRRRADSKFAHYPDQVKEEKELNRFKNKLEHLKLNMEKFEKTHLEPLLKKSKESNVVIDTEKRFKKSEIALSLRRTEPSIKTVKSLPVQGGTKSGEQESLVTWEEPLSEEITLPVGSVTAAESIKFIISGHFRDNRKPMFIIRQYRGSSIIRRKFSDFSSIKTEKGVDILISGKFYKESILEEKNNKPKSMKYKAHKKILIDTRSEIIEDGFIELFSISEFDVVVGGMFVKQRRSTLPHYTPLVSIAIKRSKHSSSASSGKREMVFSVSTPVVQNPFVQDLRKTQSDSRSPTRRRRTVSTFAGQPQGFKSLLTRIDEGEEAFECPQHQEASSRSSSMSSTSTQNSIIQKVKKPRINFTLPKIPSIDYLNVFKKRKERADGNEERKSMSTKSTHVAPLKQIELAKAKDLSLPSTSRIKTIKTTQNNEIFPFHCLFSDSPQTKTDNKSKQPKKPGFFKRVLKRLFSRRQ